MELDELLEKITEFSKTHKTVWFTFEYRISKGTSRDFEVTAFVGGDHTLALELRRYLGLAKMTKTRFGDSIGWRAKVGNTRLQFWKAQTCKIIGYDTKVVPEHTEKTPIYECPEN